MTAIPYLPEPVSCVVPPRVVWKLRELLDAERVNPNELSRVIRERLDPQFNRQGLYRMANGIVKRPDLDAIASILAGLEIITRKQFAITDLIEYDRDAEA